MLVGNPKKRQRIGSSSRLASLTSTDDSNPNPNPNPNTLLLPPPSPGGFNDSSTADVLLRLFLSPSPFQSEPFDQIEDLHIHLHSHALRKCKYFATLLSDRWQKDRDRVTDQVYRLNFGISNGSGGSISTYIRVLQLLYLSDFDSAIDSVSTALSILSVALEFLYEDCVQSCVKFLECVPWTEEEEIRVLGLIPFLRDEESKELLARVLPENVNSNEEMLYGLILAAINNYQNNQHMASMKAFVAKLLREFSSRESARRVLDRAFESSLKVVKESLEDYSSPDFRGDHNEMEAIQRLHLHTAMTNGKHLLWLIERMIELRVADTAVKEWSDQASLTADLQRTFKDDAWKNIVPGLPTVVLRCTCKLANAVAAGSILAAKQVRIKLVKDWLPVLIACKDTIPPMISAHKSVSLELEQTFLQIISTLPMSDSQELLKQCLSFSTRNVEDCPHLVTAFNTWFRRATRPPQAGDLS
ncbi:hypothetical protein RJ641_019426 [Dillenia turbinata]|uniref:At3g05675-like ankyrin-like domain-containing protein n=1 Tax=Dillenia turbinata TaxID=194707 RepID=A0AAN8UJ59_9MAGN